LDQQRRTQEQQRQQQIQQQHVQRLETQLQQQQIQQQQNQQQQQRIAASQAAAAAANAAAQAQAAASQQTKQTEQTQQIQQILSTQQETQNTLQGFQENLNQQFVAPTVVQSQPCAGGGAGWLPAPCGRFRSLNIGLTDGPKIDEPSPKGIESAGYFPQELDVDIELLNQMNYY